MRTYQFGASGKSHWIVVWPGGAWRWSTALATVSKEQAHVAGVGRRRAGLLAQVTGANHALAALGPLQRRQPRREHAGAARERLGGHAGGPQLGLERLGADRADLLEGGAEYLRVPPVPAGRDEHGGGPRDDLVQRLGDGVDALWVLSREVVQQLDSEADVALLVERDLLHAGTEGGQDVALLQVALDEVLAGLGERGLDDQVVEEDRLGQLGARAVPAQLVGHGVEPLEHHAEAPGQLGLGGLEGRADVVAGLDDLAHEAPEEDGVASFVDLLRGQEVLLLLARGGVDVRGEVSATESSPWKNRA
jgi:hypothetical protein